MRFFRRITIYNIKKPKEVTLNEKLQWIGLSLGLFSPRDRDKSCFRIFIELLKSSKKQESLSSDELAYKLNLSRGTVIHHIHNLEDAGIVISTKGKYHLKVENLKSLIDEVERDIHLTLKELRVISQAIDDELNF